MIGDTYQLEDRMKELKADEVIETVVTTDPEGLKVRLFKRYRKSRIPETDYFRLSRQQVKDCVSVFNSKTFIPISIADELTITINGSIVLFILSILINKLLALNFIQSLVMALFFSSIPMWIIFISGNFGGYETNDLSFFTTWFSRIKALLFAVLISLTAIALIYINNIVFSN